MKKRTCSLRFHSRRSEGSVLAEGVETSLDTARTSACATGIVRNGQAGTPGGWGSFCGGAALGGFYGVLHQHGYRERAYSAGHRGVGRSHAGHVAGVYVAYE